MKCIRIAPRTAPAVVEIANELPVLQAAVGGYIEAVPVNVTGCVGIVNEEGRLKHLPFNRVATQVADVHDYIVGDMLIVGCNLHGEFGDVPDGALDEVTA